MLLPQTNLNGVLGERTAKALSRHLGLTTIADLLQHYPRRYANRGELTPISEIPLGEPVTVVADVIGVSERFMKGKKGSILEIKISDGSSTGAAGTLTLTFFNQAWRQKEIKVGARGLFAGKISSYQGKLQLAHPDYELFPTEISEDEAIRWAKLPIPIYPAAANVTTWAIARSIAIVLDTLQDLPEVVPAEIAAGEGLLPLKQAFTLIHQPQQPDDWHRARNTLKFIEAFMLQAVLVKRRLDNQGLKSIPRKAAADGWLAKFDAALPFSLTSGQQQVANEIATDLARSHPMNRLLQGEVGSGKTVVALRAMLTVAESEGQSAMLAPTEVLARQHFLSIQKTLGESLAAELGLTLLTGQLNTSDRKRALLQCVSGKAKIVVGTHALIADRVDFFDLGLVVVDEQHRFGVNQREALRQKAKLPPHLLTMTATPIPRTLAVTVFGDLDVSSLNELPGGRQPISSHVVQLSQPPLVARVWQRVAEEVAAGRQVFVVCPRIDEADESIPNEYQDPDDPTEKAKPAAVTTVLAALQQNASLQNVRMAALHGRQAPDEKNQIMDAFKARELDLLVSTTVIEVGVDVPNATVMVILDADRFGISQLHQLRGRVGRGGLPGLCLLLTSAEDDSPALDRVQAVASTLDGFVLSELDLNFRREGDVLGLSQSGRRSSLKLLRVVADRDVIQRARDYALGLFQAENLSSVSGPLLAAIAEAEELASESLTKA